MTDAAGARQALQLWLSDRVGTMGLEEVEGSSEEPPLDLITGMASVSAVALSERRGRVRQSPESRAREAGYRALLLLATRQYERQKQNSLCAAIMNLNRVSGASTDWQTGLEEKRS